MFKSNVFKLAICTILCISFVLSVSCSAGSATLLPFLEDSASDEDLKFNGYKFVMLDAPNPADPTYPSTVTGDAILSRYKEVEKQFDIQLVIKTGDGEAFPSKVNMAVASGTKYADLSANWIEHIYTAYRANLVIPIDTVEGIDMSSGIFGSESMIEAARFSDGHIYGLQAEHWPIMPGITLVGNLFYNPLLINEYSQVDPYEYLENGVWNWENFQNEANACTVLSDGIYGSIAKHDEFVLNAIFSNDGEVLKYNESTGKYYIALDDEDAIEAIEWSQELASLDQCLLVLDTDDTFHRLFIDGISTFSNGDSNIGFGPPLENLKTGFRWIPFPYGPSNEDASWNTKTIMYSTYYAIPQNLDFDEKIFSTITNALFQPIEGQMEWRDYYCQYMIADDTGKSAETFIKMLDGAESANMHLFTISDRVTHLAHPLRDLQKKDGAITETLQSHITVLQSYIDDEYNK